MANNYEVVSKETVSSSEVFDNLSKKAKSDVELNYREEKLLEFFKKQNMLTLKNFEKAKKEILDLELARFDDVHIIKILEVMPQTGTQLRGILSNSGVVLVDNNAKLVLDILNKYRK